MRRARLQRRQRLIIWLGVVLVLLAFAAFETSYKHSASVASTLSTDDFIRRLDDLLASVGDAETGQRGLLPTRNPQYLAPFTAAKATIATRLSRVESSASANGVPPATIRQLDRLVANKMDELQRTIDLYQNATLAPALEEVESDRGALYMAQIRNLIEQLKRDQSHRLQLRLDKERNTQAALDAVLAFAVLIAFLLLLISYRCNVLYAREQAHVEADVRHLNSTLELRVKERTGELELRTKELEARTKELEWRSMELARSNADLTQFAYVASHDLQEPLRMIGSYMGLLARRYSSSLDENAEIYIRFAIDGANRMQALVNDLLSYARAGTQSVTKQTVSSAELLQQALQNLQITIEETGTVITHGDLPAVSADAVKLTQVMQNLIGNAIKFRKSDVRPEISITATKFQSEWCFVFADNGIGFDPKYRDRVFQIFQRLHGVGTYPGNGIGLAICRRIIEHHGGRLWADSEPGVGSTFFLTLPIRDNTPDAGQETTGKLSAETTNA